MEIILSKFFWNFAAFIIALGTLIIIHELGHFYIARYYDVMIERFSIGFGHILWKYIDTKGTEYAISAIPFGGYVKMLNKQSKGITLEQKSKAFNYKTIEQRAAIIAAGPLFNFLFAILIYWLLFIIGIPGYHPIINEIIPNSIAEKAKISPGMEIKFINGIQTPDWNAVKLHIINNIGNKEILLDLMSNDFKQKEQRKLNLQGWTFNPDKDDPIISLGIIPLGLYIEPVIVEVQTNSPAMKAGLQSGDRILKIDNQPINEWHNFVTKVRKNPNRTIQLDIERSGEKIIINLLPSSKNIGQGNTEGFAGVIPKIVQKKIESKIIQQYDPLTSLIRALEKTWQLIYFTINMLGKLLTGNIHLNNLSGPISIAYNAGISAKHGLTDYLMFLAMISINLGIVNLFPLPILDGGHLFFIFIEKIKGNPISEKLQNFCYYISSILLIILTGIAIFNDLARL